MTDKILIQKLKEGDTPAFEYLYKSYYKMAEYFILKNSGQSSDAEDVFQDALVVLYEKSQDDSFQLSCTLKTYLYSIVRNLWLKKLRDSKIQTKITDFESFVQVEEAIEEDDGLFDQVQQALSQLGEKCREIIVQFYYQKKKMTEIASSLNYTNAENAKNQKYKCMQQLKSMLNNG